MFTWVMSLFLGSSPRSGLIDDRFHRALPLALTADHEILSTSGAVETRVGYGAREKANRADRVVVAGYRQVDEIRIAIRIRDRTDRNSEPSRFRHGNGLVRGIHDVYQGRQRAHALDAADVFLEPRSLLFELRDLLFRELLVGAVFAHAFEPAQALEAALDRPEIRQRPTEPAIDDEVHRRALSLFAHDVLCLPLRADEENVTAATDGVRDVVERALQKVRGLVQVDDVNAVASAVDVRPHLRIPSLRLMAEVNASVEQIAHRERLIRTTERTGRGRRSRRLGTRFCRGTRGFLCVRGFGQVRCSFRLFSSAPPPDQPF